MLFLLTVKMGNFENKAKKKNKNKKQPTLLAIALSHKMLNINLQKKS